MKDKLNNWRSQFHQVLDGSSSPFSEEFYHKHLGKLIIALLLLYIHIQMRYTYEQTISQLAELKTELADVRYTSIAKWGELTRKNKPEIVRSMISQNADLISADEPPVKVD